MRKALHQFSTRFVDRGEAQDALEGITKMPGVEAAWLCGELRLHFITTDVADLATLTPDKLQPGQRLVYLPENPVVTKLAA